MGFFPPKKQIVYKSQLPSEELLKRLSENVSIQKSFGFGVHSSYSTPYVGKIAGSEFVVKRVIGYRNSFLPSIKGKVIPAMSGSRIAVTMKPEDFVSVFMVIWLAGVVLACIALSTVAFKDGFNASFLIPFGMLALGLAMFHFGFKVEANRSKKDFLEMFEAKIESE